MSGDIKTSQGAPPAEFDAQAFLDENELSDQANRIVSGHGETMTISQALVECDGVRKAISAAIGAAKTAGVDHVALAKGFIDNMEREAEAADPAAVEAAKKKLQQSEQPEILPPDPTWSEQTQAQPWNLQATRG